MTSGPATQIRLRSLCETSSYSVRLYGSLAKVSFRAPAKSNRQAVREIAHR
jgi:hypothetical protein